MAVVNLCSQSLIWKSFHVWAGFALVGGPARQDAPRAIDALKKLNVPYMVSLPLVFQTTEEWLASELGVHPVQVALQVLYPVGPLSCPTPEPCATQLRQW